MRRLIPPLILLTLSSLLALALATPILLDAEAVRRSSISPNPHLNNLPISRRIDREPPFKPTAVTKQAPASRDASRPPPDRRKRSPNPDDDSLNQTHQDSQGGQPHLPQADSAPDKDTPAKNRDPPRKSNPRSPGSGDADNKPESKGRDDPTHADTEDAGNPDPDFTEGDKPKPDHAKPPGTKSDHEEPADATADDSKPNNAKPDDSKSSDTSSDGSSADEQSGAAPGVPKHDSANEKEVPVPRIGGPVTTGSAPLIGLIAFAVAVLIGGFVVGTQTSLCGSRRGTDGQQYEPVTVQEGVSPTGAFGEMVSEPVDADGWNDGWEHDDWDVEEAAKA